MKFKSRRKQRGSGHTTGSQSHQQAGGFSPDVTPCGSWFSMTDHSFGRLGGAQPLVVPIQQPKHMVVSDAYPLMYLQFLLIQKRTYGVVLLRNDVWKWRAWLFTPLKSCSCAIHNLMPTLPIIQAIRGDELVRTLEELLRDVTDAVSTNMVRCTRRRRGFFPPKEMKLIRAWIKDLDRIKRGRQL